MIRIDKPLVAHTAMLIRRPAIDCYEAFVDPDVTSKFWFSKGSARLDAAREVTWDWEMYGVSSNVLVRKLEPGKSIVVEWDHDTDNASTVEWTFADRSNGATFVDIRNFGFKGDGDSQVQKLVDTTGGFSLVIAGAKAWLEHGLRLNLIPDRHPDKLVPGWKLPDPAL